jgi:hypothetical protein
VRGAGRRPAGRSCAAVMRRRLVTSIASFRGSGLLVAPVGRPHDSGWTKPLPPSQNPSLLSFRGAGLLVAPLEPRRHPVRSSHAPPRPIAPHPTDPRPSLRALWRPRQAAHPPTLDKAVPYHWARAQAERPQPPHAAPLHASPAVRPRPFSTSPHRAWRSEKDPEGVPSIPLPALPPAPPHTFRLDHDRGGGGDGAAAGTRRRAFLAKQAKQETSIDQMALHRHAFKLIRVLWNIDLKSS